jgi:hypothetical protein
MNIKVSVGNENSRQRILPKMNWDIYQFTNLRDAFFIFALIWQPGRAASRRCDLRAKSLLNWFV